MTLTRSSSMLVFHFSRLIRLIAHLSFLGLQYAVWTVAVAPTPDAGKHEFMNCGSTSHNPSQYTVSSVLP